jgi:RHH-type proline utilization regulon transcriptional repressor/proline dehydrogenase/delta 1-pyrroline-5-carboxylate dehydrogenase
LRAALASEPALAAACDALLAASPLGRVAVLPGPTGERNTYALVPRGVILSLAAERGDLLLQLAHILAAGARALWPDDALARREHAALPPAVRARVTLGADVGAAAVDAALVVGDAAAVSAASVALAQRRGAIVTLHAATAGSRQAGAYPLALLLAERTLSVNTAAAGGNATLMTLA